MTVKGVSQKLFIRHFGIKNVWVSFRLFTVLSLNRIMAFLKVKNDMVHFILAAQSKRKVNSIALT